MNKIYDQYKTTLQKIADINHSVAVLSWDKEVNLPKDGARFRSQQVATLSGMSHELFTEPKFGRLLSRLKSQKKLTRFEKKNVALTLEDYTKATKLSQEFVIKKSQLISQAYHAWVKAKAENDFSIYEAPLQALINVVREEAELLGYKDHPYDAMLDQYEPKLTVKMLEALFPKLKRDLKKLIRQISTKKQIDSSILRKRYPKDKQWAFGLDVLKSMGYDFDKGRQDISPHPFTITFNSQDVRVTTRIDERDLGNMTWSCIHEGGHALYEQGLDPENYGLPLGNAVSLSIHESQSRLWENNVARGRSFWKHHFSDLKKRFAKNFKGVGFEKFYKAINKIESNLIRTEADELHYHFHVIIRYEIEKEILEGKLNAADLPSVWNKKYKDLLGVDVPDDARGVLQDVHWSHGSFGYFPTYSLGSLYAAQFFSQAEKEIPKLQEKIQSGDTSELLAWLRKHIHQHGRYYDSEKLCKRITGEGLNTKYFLRYARKKFSEVYGI